MSTLGLSSGMANSSTDSTVCTDSALPLFLHFISLHFTSPTQLMSSPFPSFLCPPNLLPLHSFPPLSPPPHTSLHFPFTSTSTLQVPSLEKGEGRHSSSLLWKSVVKQQLTSGTDVLLYK